VYSVKEKIHYKSNIFSTVNENKTRSRKPLKEKPLNSGLNGLLRHVDCQTDAGVSNELKKS
jgi:hypothetical protein